MATEGGWYLMDDDPFTGVRRWGLDLEDRTIIRTEYTVANAFMEANQQQRNATAGERFGNFRHVASIPMHIWAREIAPRQQQGDQASIKKWLNDSDNIPFRTFRGKV
jgi:hypothetical protein